MAALTDIAKNPSLDIDLNTEMLGEETSLFSLISVQTALRGEKINLGSGSAFSTSSRPSSYPLSPALSCLRGLTFPNDTLRSELSSYYVIYHPHVREERTLHDRILPKYHEEEANRRQFRLMAAKTSWWNRSDSPI